MYKVKGSLKRHIHWWKANINNSYIVDTVENGYKLPLLDIPQHVILNNNKSARDNQCFVDSEIHKLLLSGVIVQSNEPALVTNALSVATQSNGKQRLVLDLRKINPLLNVTHFKYEDVKVASQYLSTNCFMAVFDLKSGYHHVDINVAYQQYMGFSWKGKHYTYTSCLVLGSYFPKFFARWSKDGGPKVSRSLCI
jgi:hypothetical protein